MTKLTTRFAAPLALIVFLSGCAFATRPSIAELKGNPGRFEDRTVSVEGVVTSAWNVPLVPLKLYRVDDGTGELTVIAQNGNVPTKGAHVKVKGRVEDVATLGGQNIGLHLRQTDVDYRRR
jgi:hypothetical protein